MADKIPAFTLKVKDGSKTRSIGPFRSRAAAEAEAKAYRRQGLKTRVTTGDDRQTSRDSDDRRDRRRSSDSRRRRTTNRKQADRRERDRRSRSRRDDEFDDDEFDDDELDDDDDEFDDEIEPEATHPWFKDLWG